MSFSRINYDQCALDLQLDRSVAPGNYRLFPGYVDNCKKCYPYNQPHMSNDHASVARDNCEIGFGQLAEVESEITNRKNYLEKCNEEGKNDNYKNTKVFHKPLCDRTLESEDTRFTNPIDNYRGMSLTGFYFTPYLHVNPQCEIEATRNREGNSTRHMVKDCYNLPNQDFWDKGKGLPPKPKKVSRKPCKMCCE
tara:strand:- start:33 stop:614 length:582 start_codon:yes stop_codon:yes gene_type:complete